MGNSGFLSLRHRNLLRDQIQQYFSSAELQTLCFDLGITYDDLAGETKLNKVESLIGYFERSGQTERLIHYCSQKRPHLTWTDQARVFISYKRHAEVDNGIANYLARELERLGHRPFIDTMMRAGSAWLEMIDRELGESDYLVVLLSRESADSEMVQQEVYRASEYRRTTGKPTILPIRVKYEGMLPYTVAAFVNTHQYLVWNGPEDNETILLNLVSAIDGEVSEMPSQFFASTPPLITRISEDGRPAEKKSEMHPPLPAFDPRLLTDLDPPGGTMRLNDALYIEREADKKLRRQLSRPGSITTIRASRQTGKSSLLVRGIHYVRQIGAEAVCLDLQSVDSDILAEPEPFLLYLANYIANRLRITPEQVTKYWSIPLGPQDRLTSFLESLVLPSLDRPMVLAIDEADRLLETSFYTEFFSLMRAWHNRAAYEPVWENLNLALVISTEPYLLIADPNQSPFNVGEKLLLHDFDEEQIATLNDRHGTPLSPTELAQLRDLLGGHPYLTRRALYTIVNERMGWSTFLELAASDAGPFSDHLRRQLWLLHQRPEIELALKAVVQGEPCTDEVARFRLVQAGLIRSSGDVCEARCKLYKQYFARRLS